ncbi:MAG: GtrA family protein, partial [Celeribacter sp.]
MTLSNHRLPPLAPAEHPVLLRFLAVGVLNTAVGYLVYVLAVLAGAPPQLALIVQFTLGVLWNYQTHARLVFAVEGWHRLP